MDYRFPADLETYRQEVRQFIHQQLPAGWGDTGEADADSAALVQRQFQKAMAARQWLTAPWPRQYGGLEATHWQQVVMNEEMAYFRAPSTNMGVQWVGPTLMLVGSDEQKQAHLGGIANGDVWWCTLYSEPGAGSDLAGLQTRAVRDGDDYVVNGQKIWTSGGHHANWGWLAARTDPDAPKHKGITLFTVDMQTPGITIRPLINMAGKHIFNEVFFEDVRVPKNRVVGEVNRGWYHIAVALDFERSGIGRFASAQRTLDDLTRYVRSNPRLVQDRPSARLELADRSIEVSVGRFLGYRITHLQTRGIIANYEASVSKLFGSELAQRIALTGMKMLGSAGQLLPANGAAAPMGGVVAENYLTAVSATIAAGTSEVQRGIIAGRGLGMPRG